MCVFEFLVQVADVSDASLSLFLEIEFEAHRYLFEFSALECKGILGSGLAVEFLKDVTLLEVGCRVVNELRDTEVEGNDLGCGFARGDLY